jgi:hypothetical protein
MEVVTRGEAARDELDLLLEQLARTKWAIARAKEGLEPYAQAHSSVSEG